MWVSIVGATEKSFSARPSEEAIVAIDNLRYQMARCRTRYETYRSSCEELEASDRTVLDPKRKALCALHRVKWQMQVAGLILMLKELGETFSLWSADAQTTLAERNTGTERLEDYCFRRLRALGRDFGEEPGIDIHRAVMDPGFSGAWTRLDGFVRARYTDQELGQARLELDARRREQWRNVTHIADALLKRPKRDDH